jgi:hypothetical protein
VEGLFLIKMKMPLKCLKRCRRTLKTMKSCICYCHLLPKSWKILISNIERKNLAIFLDLLLLLDEGQLSLLSMTGIGTTATEECGCKSATLTTNTLKLLKSRWNYGCFLFD